MNILTCEGNLIRVGEVKNITETYKKREFVMETDEQYPQRILFELTQSNSKLLDKVQPGELIEVHFSLRGREWQKDVDSEIKVFVTLNVYRVFVLYVTTVKVKIKEIESPKKYNVDDSPF